MGYQPMCDVLVAPAGTPASEAREMQRGEAEVRRQSGEGDRRYTHIRPLRSVSAPPLLRVAFLPAVDERATLLLIRSAYPPNVAEYRDSWAGSPCHDVPPILSRTHRHAVPQFPVALPVPPCDDVLRP